MKTKLTVLALVGFLASCDGIKGRQSQYLDAVFQGEDAGKTLTLDFRSNGRMYMKMENSYQLAYIKKQFGNVGMNSKWDSATYEIVDSEVVVTGADSTKQMRMKIETGYLAFGPLRLERVK